MLLKGILCIYSCSLYIALPLSHEQQESASSGYFSVAVSRRLKSYDVAQIASLIF